MKSFISSKFVKECIFWATAILIMFILLHNIGLDIYNHTKQFLLLFIIFTASAIIHVHRSTKSENYISESIFAIHSSKKRICQYDYLRVLAVSFVIITHAIQVDISKGYMTDEIEKFVFTIIYTLTLSCNLIYVMLSGALLLPYKEERLVDFYYKRVTKIIIPLVIYYIFYLWQNLELTNITIKETLFRLLQGNTPESPHYWLIYEILSIYIVIPFFRYMFKNLTYKKITSLVIFILTFMSINTFLKIDFAVNTFISSWLGVAIIGYWVTREETRKYDYLLIFMGFIMCIFSVFLIKTNNSFLDLICNCSPVMVFISIGIFSFVFKYNNIFCKDFWVIRILSQYSYSIILIHWWTLHWITFGKLNIKTNMYNGVGIIFAWLLTLILSFLMALFIDCLIITPVDFMFDKCINIIKMHCRKQE